MPAFLSALVWLTLALSVPAMPVAATDRPRESFALPGPLGEREATVANRAGLSITQLFVSPSAVDAWGDDRLGESVLEPGRSTRLKLGRMRDCAFDLLAIYEDASREERLGQNLCRNRNVAFDGKARVVPRVAEQQRRELSLVNRSARVIQQVFVSQADTPEWGEDLLAAAISVGETGVVVFRGACTVDVRVVFDNRAAEERRGIDLCQGGALSIEPGWTTADEPPAPPV